jgi:bifunctional DNA-binding transcriptional regulator/antitoxin component of YhaV-PrlF toxin-antitoxin module
MYNVLPRTYDGWVIPTRVKVTRTGQVSLPAELRHRWGVGTVLVIDRGDYAIVRPVPADPVATLRGAHAGPGPASERVRANERAAEEARESGRRGGE